MEQKIEKPTVLLRRTEVESRVALGRTALLKRVAKGTFPRPIRLGGTRTVRWAATEVDAWIAQQINQARKGV